jgi:iron complex outermembrane receptor protein
VINIITLQNFNGAEATAKYGMHFGDGHWDGRDQKYEVTIGSSGDRYSAMFNLGFHTEGPIRKTHRDLTKEPGTDHYGTGDYFGNLVPPSGFFNFVVPPGATLNPGTAGAIPNPAVTGLTSAQCPTGAGGSGSPLSGMLLPRCELTLIDGRTGASAGDFRPYKDRTYGVVPAPGTIDRHNYSNYQTDYVPHESKTLYAQGHFDITPQVNIHATAYYDRETATFWGNPPSFQIKPATNNANILASNPYNPFGFDLNATGDATTNVQNLRRFLLVEGTNKQKQLLWTMYISAGFGGDFDLGDRNFNWTADYTYDHLDQSGSYTFAHSFYRELFKQQLDGDLSTCQGTQVRECVPFNPFGAPYTLSPAMLAYAQNYGGVSPRPQAQQIINVNLTSSDVFDLPAGPLGFAIGDEFKVRHGKDFGSSAGYFSGKPSRVGFARENGRYHVNSVYGELRIPVLANLPFVKSFDLDYAVRYSKYSSFGDTVTNDGSFRWKPTKDLIIRGGIAQGYRAPKINDLFSGRYSTFSHVDDLCDSRSSTRPDTCLTGIDGLPPVPADYIDDGVLTKNTLGANPSLQPEISLSKNIGFVYSPSAVPGLSLQAEYYWIFLGNIIRSPGSVGTLLDQCYRFQDLNFCKLLTRAPDGRLTHDLRVRTNTRSEKTDGFIGRLHYRFPSTSFGDFSVGLNYNHERSFRVIGPLINNADGSHVEEAVGNGAHPRNRAHLNLSWNLGNWSASYQIQYSSASWFDCNALEGQGFGALCVDEKNFINPTGQPIDIYRTPAIVYNDVNATYNFSSINTALTVGLNNIFGYKGAKYGRNAFYRVPGRFVYARLTARF